MTSPLTDANLSAWKARLAQARQELGGGGISASYLAAVDELVASLARGAAWDQEGRAVAALGGYGRGELAPRSDIDLLFLVRRARDRGGVDGILYPLWDLGFEVGHALRTPADCASLAGADLTVATALLDARLLLGDGTLLAEARRSAGIRPGGSRRSRGWTAGLRTSVEQRRARFGEVSHLLEPHLKEGRGGLRDFHACRWLHACLGGDAEAWAAGAPDRDRVLGAVAFLTRVRNVLHAVAGRKTDHLTFEYHREVAERIRPGEPLERFFEELHRAGHRIALAWDRAADAFGPAPSLFRRETGPPRGAPQIEEAVVGWARAGGSLPPALDRALADPEAGHALRGAVGRLLRARLPLAPLLRELHRRDRLALLAPEVDALTHRVQYDARQCFTVGVHCIETLAALEDLWLGAREREEPHLTRVAGALARPWIVRMAALCHDLGEAAGESGWARAAAPATLSLAERFGLSAEDAREVLRLVGAHREIPAIAFGRDLEDPAAMADARAVAGDPSGLDALVTLAYADLLATNPREWSGVWSDWKRDLLLTLHSRAFGEEEVEPDRLARAREAAAAEGRRLGLADPVAHWTGMPLREAIQVPPDHLARLLQLAGQVDGAAAAWHVEARGPFLEVLGVARLLPRLHSNVTATLADCGLDVLSFQSHAWADGTAHLWVRALTPERGVQTEGIARRLTEGVTGKSPPAPRRRSVLVDARRDAAPLTTQVRLVDEDHPFRTALEVQCRDRPGLLSELTAAFEGLGLTVEYALVTTHGPVARDVFHLRDIFGRRVAGEGKRRALLARVAEVARGQHSPFSDAAHQPADSRRNAP